MNHPSEEFVQPDHPPTIGVTPGISNIVSEKAHPKNRAAVVHKYTADILSLSHLLGTVTTQ